MDRRHFSRFFALFLLVVFALSSCEANAQIERPSALCVASWNVQNLFNAQDDGAEYSEYKAQSGWSQKDYDKRLSNVRKTLCALPKAQDYIVVLNEIENSDVVKDILFSRDVSNLGICYYAATRETDSAIQIAVVSSLPISDANIHQVGDGLRPILEVGFDTSWGRVFVLAVHFKSNVGGVEQTSEARKQSARTVSEIAAALQRNNPGCLVLVCGDMNEECWDDGAIGRVKASPLQTSSAFERGKWYCFYLDESLGLSSFGSYMYNGDWKGYDNILVSLAGGDGNGLDFKGAGILNKGFLMTADGRPFAWSRDLLAGISDHLPVWTLFDDK